MPRKPPKDNARTGVFGPEAWKWRNSIVRIELPDEKPFHARLREIHDETAEIEVLDERNLKGVVGQRILDWPPDGQITVIRTAI